MPVSWPIRSVLAGTAGTATMTLAYAAERRVRHARAELATTTRWYPARSSPQ